MKTLHMRNLNTFDEIVYNIYDSYIEVIKNETSVSKFQKTNKCNNQIIMDLINSGIKQGFIISSLQVTN